jgi:hypothetical protein
MAVIAVLMAAAVSPGAAAADTALSDGDPVQTLTSDVRIDDGPTVVVTPAGTAIALWLQRNDHVMTAMRPAGSESWSTPTLVSSNGFYAVMALRGANRAVVGWQRFTNQGAAIEVRTLRADGGLSDVQRVAGWENRGGVTVALTIASNPRGDMVAAWTRGQRVRAACRSAGQDWQAEHVFSDLDAYSLEGVANVDRQGEADVLFAADRGGRLSTLRAYHRDTNGIWSGQTVGEFASGLHYLGRTFDAAINGRGDITATWMRRAGQNHVWHVYARYQPAGGAFESAAAVASRARNPVVAVDQSGQAALAFHSREGADTQTNFAQRVGVGDWSAPLVLSSSSTEQLRTPQIGIETNATGEFVVHTQGVHITASGDTAADHRLVSCPIGGPCGSEHIVRGPSEYDGLAYDVRPDRSVDIVWAFGCATEECLPTGVRARRLAPL